MSTSPSRPSGSTLASNRTDAAAALPVVAAMGGGLLVALADFLPARSTRRDVPATTLAPNDPRHPQHLPSGDR